MAEKKEEKEKKPRVMFYANGMEYVINPYLVLKIKKDSFIDYSFNKEYFTIVLMEIFGENTNIKYLDIKTRDLDFQNILSKFDEQGFVFL